MKKTLLLSAFLAVSGVMNAQWTTQNTNFTEPSRGTNNLEIVDANTVWGIGVDGATGDKVQEFTRTSNGGTTWTSGAVDIDNFDLEITNISPISGTTAWVGAVHPQDGLGGVWKTTDGGLNWVQQNETAYTTSGTLSSFFNVVHFFDANVGITQGDPIGTGVGSFELYRTTNGGTTWTPITSPAPLSGEYGYNGGNVAAGNSFWFVTNKGKIYRTTDFGVTWTKLNTPINDFGGVPANGNLLFSDNNNGIIKGGVNTGTTANPVYAYTLYKTTDGGTTWSAGTSYTAPYTTLTYIPGTSTIVGIGRTGAGTVASPYVNLAGYSSDNGTTWTPIVDAGTTQRIDVNFFNGTTGWASSFTSATLTGGMQKYTGASLGLNDNVAASAKLKAYPNPTGNVLNLSGVSINQVVAYDLLGKQVMNTSFAGQNEVTLDVSSLQTGMYLLSVTNDLGATETIKFAKK